MTIDEFYSLNLDDILYNIKTGSIVKLETCFIKDRKREEKDCLCVPMLGKPHAYKNVYAKDCDLWSKDLDAAPIEVKFEILSIRFFELEQFVYSRLH